MLFFNDGKDTTLTTQHVLSKLALQWLLDAHISSLKDPEKHVKLAVDSSAAVGKDTNDVGHLLR
jgi:hypothetical protein